MAVDRKRASAQKSDIRKRTPLEQAIAEQTDARLKWDAKMASKGFKRTSMMVHVDRLDEVKAFIKRVNEEALAGRCHD